MSNFDELHINFGTIMDKVGTSFKEFGRQTQETIDVLKNIKGLSGTYFDQEYISDLYEIDRDIHLWVYSNNWRKFHGYPMRRKMKRR